MRSITYAVRVSMLLVFLTTHAFADPILESEQENIDGGLTVVTLFVNGNDGLETAAFFIDLVFTSTVFNEVPGVGGVDITSSGNALWDDSLGGLNDDYIDNRTMDSFFYASMVDPWSGVAPCNGVEHDLASGSYRVCLGTSPGQGGLRLILGQLVVPTGETVFFEGGIARSSNTFSQSGAFTTVPEPSSLALVSVSLLLLAASRRPRKRLRFRRPNA